jgi:hypothetical protein
MLRQALILTCLLLGLGVGLTAEVAKAAKRQQSPCSKPPELVSKRALPKEEQEKARKIRPQGPIAIVVSEDGDVVDARVVHATSDEAGRLLIDLAKGMKSKPRPGCGPFKTIVNFNLSE